MQDLKNKAIEFAKKESKFLCLAVGWLFFAMILPIIFINNKYHLFVKANDGLRFTGWGIVALLIGFIVIYVLLWYIVDAFSVKYRPIIKVIKGFQRVLLPLILLCIMCNIISNNIGTIENVLWNITISEAIAIIINPFPYFVYKHKNADTREAYGLNGKD